MPVCVTNTSPLIALSAIKRLDLLQDIFPETLVPDAVFREAVTDGVGWLEANQLQQELVAGAWLTRVKVADSAFLQGLRDRLGGSGEAEAIVLAKERSLPVLLDEMAGRRAAAALGLQVIGSLWILRQSKFTGRIKLIRPVISQMIERGIYYHDDLVERFLKEVGE